MKCSTCGNEMMLSSGGYYSGGSGADLGVFHPPEYVCVSCGATEEGI